MYSINYNSSGSVLLSCSKDGTFMVSTVKPKFFSLLPPPGGNVFILPGFVCVSTIYVCLRGCVFICQLDNSKNIQRIKYENLWG